MSGREWNTGNRWRPDPALKLRRLNHPTISKDHPAFHELAAQEQQLVTALQDQYDRWSHKLYFKRGLSGRLIAALNGYRCAAKLAGCMMKSNPYTEGDTLGRCGLDWFCEFDAYLRGQDLLKKYAGAWTPGGWYEMVLSLEVGVCPADPEQDFIREVHDAMVAVAKRLQQRKFMLGYVAWLEIKVHQFYPFLSVTPHVHVMLRCDCPPDRRVLNILVADEWIGRQLESAPDLFIAPVRSEAHFYELLSYIKPIDLYGPYERGYRAAKADGKVELLHREVRLFFEALAMETTEYQGFDFVKALKDELKKLLPKAISKRHRKAIIKAVVQTIAKTTPKTFWQTFNKARKQRLTKPLRLAIVTALKMAQQGRVKLVTRRRFLYGGNCHGSATNALGLEKAARSTKGHQDAIRAKVAMAREAEEQCRRAEDGQAAA